MKILKLPPYGRPEQISSTHLSSNLNDAFYKAGFRFEIYCPTPSRGISEEQIKKYKKIKYEEFSNGTIVIHRFSMFREGNNPIQRAIRYILVNLIQYFKGIKVRDIDLIFAQSTPPTQGLLCALVKRKLHVPFVYNLQDIFPDSLVGTGLARKDGLLWKIGRVIENFTYRNADKIIVISEDFKKNIMAKGVPEEKIEVIYNWVDQDTVKDIPRSENKLLEKYNLDPSKFYVTYCGNIGLTQNMDMLMEVMQELCTKAPDICLVLNGEGAYKDTVIKKIGGKTGSDGAIRGTILPNVIMLPFQPYEDISHVFSLGDVGIIISKPGVGANSLPSKTWSIMSASRPVLANFDENEIKTILENNKCGIFTKAGDKVAFTDAIIYLYQHPELCREYGKNGRQFVMENLTKEVGTAKYVEVIKEVVSKR